MNLSEHANSLQKQARDILKILLVDDEEKNYIKSLQDILPAEEFKVVGAANREGVEKSLKESPLPTVIVIDIYLPDDGRIRGGYNIAKVLRKRLGLDVPIIAYSNFAYHIKHAKTTDKEFDWIRKKLKSIGVYEFIDKKKDEGGEPNLSTINELAICIKQVVTKLKGGLR